MCLLFFPDTLAHLITTQPSLFISYFDCHYYKNTTTLTWYVSFCVQKRRHIISQKKLKNIINFSFPFPTLGLAKKMIVLGSFDLPSRFLTFKVHFRILSSNTKSFFSSSSRKLKERRLCDCYAHLSFNFVQYFLNTFEVGIEVTQNWISTRFQENWCLE